MREECCSFAEHLTGLFGEIVFRAMNVDLVRDLEEQHVTLSQAQALTWIAGRRGRAVGEVAEGLGVSHPAAVKLLQRLEEKGLVRRSVPESDHRQSVIFATPAGLRLANAVRRERAHRLAQVLDRMPVEQRHAFIRGLEGFVTAALQDAGALDGLCWNCQTLLPTDCRDFAELAGLTERKMERS